MTVPTRPNAITRLRKGRHKRLLTRRRRGDAATVDGHVLRGACETGGK
jgi:hypothetical protein